MAANPNENSRDLLGKQSNVISDNMVVDARRMELSLQAENSLSETTDVTSLPGKEDLNELGKASACSDEILNDVVGQDSAPMEVDLNHEAITSNRAQETDGDLSQTTEPQSTSGVPNCRSLSSEFAKDGSTSSSSVPPTMVDQGVGYGYTKVEVTESSTNVEADESSASAAYPVYVNTLKEAEEVLHRFESNTKSRFCVWRCPRDFGACQIDLKGKRIFWREFVIEDRITVKSNGIPFVMMGRKVYDCHRGRDRNIALKQRAKLKREENEVKKRNITAPGKKLDCPARIVFCEIIYFPGYKIATDTKYYRSVAAKAIRQDFTDGKVNLGNIERRIYMSFPSEKDHKGHPVGKGSNLSERVDQKVSNKITHLVGAGILNEEEMKEHLDNYIAKEVFPGRAKPFHSNKRYYPSKGVIRLKMYHAYILKRLSLLDPENIQVAVTQWKNDNSDDKVYFRPYSEVNEFLLNGTIIMSVEEENTDELRVRQKIAQEHFLFVHQNAFQNHLLKRYGSYICFLDPAYRTVKYALPIFFLTVKTNVDYQVVATFVVEDERKESVKEALELLKSWNPEWKPKVFMVDNDAEEMAAVEDCFPGSSVFLSDFHREQSWERWLSRPSNGMMPHREAILVHLRRLAQAASSDQFQEILDALVESDTWKCDYGKSFRTWFEKTWLNLKQRWVWSYKVGALCNLPTTNNTLEKQNKEFNHEQLVEHNETPLSEMLKILIGTVMPAKRVAYFEQNTQITVSSAKDASSPTFFHNRPRQLTDHIAACMMSSYDITPDDIAVNSPAGGEFLVRSYDSDVEYNVQFGNDETFPRCECADWLKTMIPCKHFVAIMRDFQEWNWSRFPESYRSSPYVTLDQIADPNATQSDPAENDKANTMALQSGRTYELPLQKSCGRSIASRCRDMLNEINNMAYTVHDMKAITTLCGTLEEALTKLKLSAVDDDLVVASNPETSPKTTKYEEKKTDGELRPMGTSFKSGGKRTSESGGTGLPESDVASKSAKLDPMQACAGNEMIDRNVLEEVDLMNIDYYRALNASADGGTAVNTGGVQGPNDNLNTSFVFNASQGSETLGVSQLNDKKDDEVSQTSDKTDDEVVLVNGSTAGCLSKHEESLVLRNETITNESINLALALLRKAFPHLKGFQRVARGGIQSFEPVTGDFIQILHDGDQHWVCASHASYGECRDPAAVAIYDSMNQGYVAKFTKQQLASFLCIQSSEMKVIMKSVQQQTGAFDCGVFAIAFATALAFGHDPSKQRFDVSKLRPHLADCLKSKKMSPFPELKIGSGDIVLSKRKVFTIELFCTCRMPYEKPKTEADLMAQCGSCKEWFHQKCEKIALAIFKASGLSFMCTSCLKKT